MFKDNPAKAKTVGSVTDELEGDAGKESWWDDDHQCDLCCSDIGALKRQRTEDANDETMAPK